MIDDHQATLDAQFLARNPKRRHWLRRADNGQLVLVKLHGLSRNKTPVFMRQYGIDSPRSDSEAACAMMWEMLSRGRG